MVKKVIWSPQAEEDFNLIFEFKLLRDNDVALSWRREVLDKLSLLRSFPEMGAMVPEFNVGFVREVFINEFKLAYMFYNNELTLLKFVRRGWNYNKL